LSATYYHQERDCILNLDDRRRNPQLLKKQSGSTAVTYLAMTCRSDGTTAALAKASFNDHCERVTPMPSTTTTPAPRKRKMGANSDWCFLELSDYVLEGTALAIESNISHQECKCRCLTGESSKLKLMDKFGNDQLRYGESCQSFQYYFDSSTCLINKQNRFSNPENFNFVPSSKRHSYFEHKCATKGT
uniref:Apple domain-containing protein n=1 Tax=Nippostrongylus brasiliensis TaxID=27835 RepID=A0A0N4Y5X9_NIPBR